MTTASDDPQLPFRLDRAPIWPAEDGRLEPVFLVGPLWVEFEEPEPAVPAFEVAAVPWLGVLAEFALSEPDPAAAEPDEPPPEPVERTSPRGFAASLSMHLLALLLGLLVLAVGNGAPAGPGDAFPVQLVFAEPAALPPARPVGEAVAQDAAPPPPIEAAPPPKPASLPPAPPLRAHAAAVVPPPKAAAAHPPRPAPTGGAPAPAAVREVARTAMPSTAPAPPAPTASAAAEHPIAVKAVAATPATGSGAGGGDYLAYLEQLTRPHLSMLSPAFLAGRRGRTTLSIAVLDDGTISRIGIKHSSGYPDIDTRIEAMVHAIGRFPPLPQQLRRPGTDLDFDLVFPDVLQQ